MTIIPLLWLGFSIILVIIGLGATTHFTSSLYVTISAFGQTENGQSAIDTIPVGETAKLVISGAIGGGVVKGLDIFFTWRGKIGEEKRDFMNRKVKAYSAIGFYVTRAVESRHFQEKTENPKRIEDAVEEMDNLIKENLIFLHEDILPDWMEVRSNRDKFNTDQHREFVEIVLGFRNKVVKTYNRDISWEYWKVYKRHITPIKPETVELNNLKFLSKEPLKQPDA